MQILRPADCSFGGIIVGDLVAGSPALLCTSLVVRFFPDTCERLSGGNSQWVSAAIRRPAVEAHCQGHSVGYAAQLVARLALSTFA